MVTSTQTSFDNEPSPEFNDACMALIRSWEHGDSSLQDISQRLKDLSRQAETSGHIANQGRAEHLSGYVQHYIGNYAMSISHYENARRLFERVSNRRRVATMDLNQGENYRYKGEFKRAQRLYRSAYEVAADLADVRLQAMAISNEGLMLISMGDNDTAYKALMEGYRLTELWVGDEKNLPALRTEIHFGLATIALAEKEALSAWEHAHYSLENAQTSDNLRSVGLAYRILGDAMTLLGTVPTDAQFDNPDDYYRAALDAFAAVEAQAEMGRTVYCHAKSLAARGRRRHAAQRFREAMVVFTHLGMTVDAAKAAEAQLQVL